MTFSYIFKWFPRLFLVAIIPAIVVGFSVRPLSSMSYLMLYSKTEINSFVDVLFIFFNKFLLKNVLLGILMFVVCLCSLSYLLSIVEKHFKVGRLSIKNPFANINNSFSSVLKSLLLLSAMFIVYKFLLVCIFTLIQIVIQGYGIPNKIVVTIVTIVYNVSFVLVIAFIMIPILLESGVMIVYGYGFADSLDVAMKFMSGKHYWQLFFGLITPFVISTILGLIIIFTNAIEPISISVNIVVSLLFLIYVPTLVMVEMYDLSQIERRDLKTLF